MNKEFVINAAYVRSVLNYDPNSGIFTWKAHRAIRSGVCAGAKNKHGYVQISFKDKLYLAHRLAWLHVYGMWPNGKLDHRNRVKIDNSISNLREASNSDNLANRPAQRNNKLGVKGVSKCKHTRGYKAKIMVRGQLHNLGVHSTIEAAHMAYVSAAERLFGEFSRG